MHITYENGSQSVIVYLSLKSADVSHNEKAEYSILGWTLAFAVDLQLVDTSINGRTVKQLILNFKSKLSSEIRRR